MTSCFDICKDFTFNDDVLLSSFDSTLYQYSSCSYFACLFLDFFVEYLSCRQVLNLMVIMGFMLNYALRVNLTIAIVAMVEEPVNKPASKIPGNAAASALPTDALNKNDTFYHNSHSTEELSSAAHTLPISTTPEPFQSLTDKVSFSCCFPLFFRFAYNFI